MVTCICSLPGQRFQLGDDQLWLVVAVLEDNILKDVTFDYQVDLSASAAKLFLVRSFELNKGKRKDQVLMFFLLGRRRSMECIFTCSVTFSMISGGSERKVDIAVGRVQDPEKIIDSTCYVFVDNTEHLGSQQNSDLTKNDGVINSFRWSGSYFPIVDLGR